MDTELIVLVDAQGKPVGSAPKLASHHANTPLHQAFSCFIFNENGEFLLTKRAHVKKVWPDVWTNSVCGHPAPSESIVDAIRRRAQYELGIDALIDIALVESDYRYTTPLYNGIIENEVCPIYVARVQQTFNVNPLEVDEFQWVAWSAISDMFKVDPDAYSYWFKQEYPIVADFNDIGAYAK